MSGPEETSTMPVMPPSHRIKAASVSAFQDFQNARANREFALPPQCLPFSPASRN